MTQLQNGNVWDRGLRGLERIGSFAAGLVEGFLQVYGVRDGGEKDNHFFGSAFLTREDMRRRKSGEGNGHAAVQVDRMIAFRNHRVLKGTS